MQSFINFFGMPRPQTLDPEVVNRILADNVPRKKVAEWFDVTPSAVTNCVQRASDGDTEAKIGRPSKLTDPIREFLRDTLTENPYQSCTDLSQKLYDRFLVDVHRTTVGNWLHSMGFRSTTAVLKKALSEDAMMSRLTFSEDWLKKNQHNFLFCDEKQFDSSGNSNRCWIPKGSKRPVVPIPPTPIRVQVLGRISWVNGKSVLIFIPEGERQTAQLYLKRLKGFKAIDGIVDKCKNPYFYHDNAPIQTAKIVQEYLDTRDVHLPIVPPYSPELNPIEKIWGIMSSRMSVVRPQSRDEMVDQIQQVWESISLQEIRNTIDELSVVKQKIIDANGSHITEE